jgi:hypothetical protein
VGMNNLGVIKMNESIDKQSDYQKKSSWRKYLNAAVIIPLLIIVSMVYFLLMQEQKYDPASEILIREAAAAQLNKNPNELKDDDFAKITKFSLNGKPLRDLNLLEKFTNLQVLHLDYILLPDPHIPKWMIVMAKLKIIDLHKTYTKNYIKKYLIDLSPLENLSKLQKIYILGSPIKDLNPLAKLQNLQEIHISHYQLFDYGLLQKGGGKLQKAYLIGSKSFGVEQGCPIPYVLFNINEQPPDSNVPFPKIIYHTSEMTWASSLQRAEMMINSEVEGALK